MDKRRLMENLENQEKAAQEMSDLPKGSIQPYKRKDTIYYYLAYRDGNKVKRTYIGREGDPVIEETRALLESRKRLEAYLKALKKEQAAILRDSQVRLQAYQKSFDNMLRTKEGEKHHDTR